MWELFTAGSAYHGVPTMLLGHQVRSRSRHVGLGDEPPAGELGLLLLGHQVHVCGIVRGNGPLGDLGLLLLGHQVRVLCRCGRRPVFS
jgi:hypothetical protein